MTDLADTTNLTTPTNDAPADDATLLGGAASDAPATDTATGNEPAPATDAPVIPEKYELTLPEGMEALDEALLGEATPILQELKLDNEGASKLLPLAQQLMQRGADASAAANEAQFNALKADWLNETKNDATIGGDNFKASLSKAAKGLDAMGFPEGHPFRAVLNDTGLGNHPDMIRTFVRVGELIGEGGDFVRGDAAAPVVDVKAQMYPNDVKG